MLRKILLVSVLTTACVPTFSYSPPSHQPPPSGYVQATHPPDQLWEAVLDYLADTGADWRPWSEGERFVQGEIILVSSPRVVTVTGQENPFGGNVQTSAGVRRLVPDSTGLRFADCGSMSHVPLAGAGDLRADVTVRVREGDTVGGPGLLKVAIPRIWVTNARISLDRTLSGPLPCVSTGVFEREAARAIIRRAVPNLIPPPDDG